MIRDDILNLASDAGLADVLGSWCQECGCTDNALVRFAELVEAKAITTEREHALSLRGKLCNMKCMPTWPTK